MAVQHTEEEMGTSGSVAGMVTPMNLSNGGVEHSGASMEHSGGRRGTLGGWRGTWINCGPSRSCMQCCECLCGCGGLSGCRTPRLRCGDVCRLGILYDRFWMLCQFCVFCGWTLCGWIFCSWIFGGRNRRKRGTWRHEIHGTRKHGTHGTR